MSKTVKLADIAERVGVSVVTVSKALSGQKGMSEEMREKIIAIANELGYVQPSARKQEERQSHNIGVLIHEKYLGEYSFYWQMYQKLAQYATGHACFSMFEVVSEVMEKDGTVPKIIEENKTDGIVIIGSLQEKYIKKITEQADVPVMFMDYMDRNQSEDAVIPDSYYGGYYMTNYLIAQGHKKIAYVGTASVTGSIMDRYLGYVKSLSENGLEVRKDWVIEDRDILTGGIDEEKKIKLPKEMPTAFFCNCDLTAGALIKKLEKEGFRVPEDVSVAGYDDFIYPGLCDVELTTYAVDMTQMAKVAVKNLIRKIEGRPYRSGTSIIEGKIIVRDSVKKIKN